MGNHRAGHTAAWLRRHPGHQEYVGQKRPHEPGRHHFFACSARIISDGVREGLCLLYTQLREEFDSAHLFDLGFSRVVWDPGAAYGALVGSPEDIGKVKALVPHAEGEFTPLVNEVREDRISFLDLPLEGRFQGYEPVMRGRSALLYRAPPNAELEPFLKKGYSEFCRCHDTKLYGRLRER